MKRKISKIIASILFVIVFALLTSIRTISAELTIIEPEGIDYDFIGINAVNNKGEVAGTVTKLIPGGYEPDEVHAFTWSKDKGFKLLNMGTDEKIWTWANDINENGDIVGDMAIISDYGYYESYSAFLYTEDSGMISLKPLLGEGFSGAGGINNQGQITGSRSTESGSSTAFLLEDGMIRDLGSLGSGHYSYSGGAAINNLGHIVGDSMTDDFEGHAFKWTKDNGMRDLGTLPGRTESWAIGINDKNEVVGNSWRYECAEDECYAVDHYAFFWSEEKGMMNIGTLPGMNYSQATAINNKGQLVGICEKQDPGGFPLDSAAFIYSEDSGMIDFGEMIGEPYILWVTDINDHGQVTGMGYSPENFIPFAFLWTPPLKEVTIDIKPGGEPNAINKNGKGVISVAVLGGPDFNVKDIDFASLRLEELLKIKAVKNDILLINYEDVNEDEYQDLVAQFENADIFSEDDTIATLTGNLNDGTSIIGTDSIRIIP
ncbi:MAG: DUF3466 family protein [bacterium]